MQEQLHDTPRDVAVGAVAVTNPHLSVATVAAFVDGTLDAGVRADAERHLAECAVCRGEIAEVADLAAELPVVPRRRSWGLAAGGLAAAGIIGLLFLSPQSTPNTSSAERTARPTAATLEIVQPPSTGSGALRDGHIVWRAVEPRATYRVTVTDTTGATRFTAETPDTTMVLPMSTRLEAGARYYLYVDALRADGWSLQSGPRMFTTTP